MRRLTGLLAAATLLLAVPPRATEAQSPDASTERRWGIVLVWGGPRGVGTAADVEAAMIRDGFDDSSQCWLFCEGTIRHPKSHSGAAEVGSSLLLELSYRPSAPFGLALTLADSHIGWTSGYRAGSGFMDSHYLFLHYGATTVAVTPLLGVGPLELQLGPALHRAETWVDDVGRRAQTQHAYRVGILAGAGLSLRLYRALHLEGRAQYRYVGSVEVGPHTADNGVLSEFRADFSHAFVGFGLGVRF